MEGRIFVRNNWEGQAEPAVEANVYLPDRGLVASQHPGDLSLSVAGLLQCIDLVSFLSGELRVRSHQCSFDFVV